MEKRKENPKCYLRSLRRKWGLTVPEMAALIGFKSAPHISRIEHGKRNPTIRFALACQVIFGVAPSEMFPHVFTVVEDRVMWNIQKLHSALEKITSIRGLRKRELCDEAMKRALARKPKHPEVI